MQGGGGAYPCMMQPYTFIFLVIEVSRSNISLQNYFRPEVKSQGRWNWGCRGEGKEGFASQGVHPYMMHPYIFSRYRSK